jgi:hypothetical protein
MCVFVDGKAYRCVTHHPRSQSSTASCCQTSRSSRAPAAAPAAAAAAAARSPTAPLRGPRRPSPPRRPSRRRPSRHPRQSRRRRRRPNKAGASPNKAGASAWTGTALGAVWSLSGAEGHPPCSFRRGNPAVEVEAAASLRPASTRVPRRLGRQRVIGPFFLAERHARLGGAQNRDNRPQSTLLPPPASRLCGAPAVALPAPPHASSAGRAFARPAPHAFRPVPSPPARPRSNAACNKLNQPFKHAYSCNHDLSFCVGRGGPECREPGVAASVYRHAPRQLARMG